MDLSDADSDIPLTYSVVKYSSYSAKFVPE